jgi:hypothetical protein
VLVNFPHVKALYDTQEGKWRKPGIREVLETFIFLYANADVLEGAFVSTGDGADRTFLAALNQFCINFLGCGVTGSTEDNKLCNVEMSLGPWLKKGLAKTESQLAKYANDSEKYDDYVRDNLDNTVKAYFRKLSSAEADAKAYDKSESNAVTGGSEAERYQALLLTVQSLTRKNLYLEALWDHMKDIKSFSFETMLGLVNNTSAFLKSEAAVPDETDIRTFLTGKQAAIAALTKS